MSINTMKYEILKIKQITDIKTKYNKEDSILEYTVLGIDCENVETEVTFKTLFNLQEIYINQEKINKVGFVLYPEHSCSDITATIEQLIVAEEGVIMTIKKNKKKMTIEDIERELGYEIELIN